MAFPKAASGSISAVIIENELKKIQIIVGFFFLVFCILYLLLID